MVFSVEGDAMHLVDLDVEYNVLNATEDIIKVILQLTDCNFGAEEIKRAVMMALVATDHGGLLK